MSLFTYREPGKDGYFLLLLSPDDDAERREYPAKDVVFVLDVSGSMEEDGEDGEGPSRPDLRRARPAPGGPLQHHRLFRRDAADGNAG